MFKMNHFLETAFDALKYIESFPVGDCFGRHFHT